MAVYNNFLDIPRMSPDATYNTTVGWRYLEQHLDPKEIGCPVITDPDFQRAHVWTEAQQIAFVEFKLRDGMGSNDIRWNHPYWMQNIPGGELVLVDGKQRLQAVRRFMRNEIPAFGTLYKDYGGKLDSMKTRFNFLVNTLPDRAAVLRWYLEINTGGVVHSDEEIARVQELLDAETVQRAKVG